MTVSDQFNPKNNLKLIGLKNYFIFLKDLIEENKLPKVILLTGNKGIGKFSMTNHLMHFFFDNENYDINDNKIRSESAFHHQFVHNIFPNIIYLNGSDFKNIKIDDIRDLKKTILKTPIRDMKRFIILDDIEIFNTHSVNGLLKIIEEPSNNNYFILINNKSRALIDTLRSRCCEIKILLDEKIRIEILNYLSEYFNQKIIIDCNLVKATPGDLIKYNYILEKNNINIDESFIKNLKLILNIYKKEKDIIYKNLIFFLVEYFFQRQKSANNKIKMIENRSFVLKYINEYFVHNLNQNTLMNSLENRFNRG